VSSEEPAETLAENPPAKKKLPDRGRLARLVALLGVVVLVLATKSMVLPLVPSDRDIELRLENPKDVTGLDIRWSAAGGSEEATTTMHFAPGAAPASVLAKVRLPDGSYEVTIAVERASGVDSTRRRVTLDSSGRITIPLR
jgi:hypothetical protein